MRKREIHSIAHWLMMTILLMFPILMVGISGFGHSQHSETTGLTTTLISDNAQVITGNNYMINLLDSGSSYSENIFINSSTIDYDYLAGTTLSYDVVGLRFYPNNTHIRFIEPNSSVHSYELNDEKRTYLNGQTFNLSSGNLVSPNQPVRFFMITYQTVQLDYRDDINQWCGQFIDLPINSWYKSLMNVIGVGFTNSTVMNVIYLMPVYILWVFIFDVIVDCFLVIIKLPHKLLNRLSGGENE